MTTTDTTERVECRKCHRPLRAESSRSLGIGPRCAAIEAATEGLNARQAEKALELVADGGVVPTSRKGVYRVSSGNGDAVYLTSVKGPCNCDHGRRAMTAKICYHVGGARLAAHPVVRPSRRSLAKAA